METLISVDIETTGPVPGLYCMIELGAVVVSDSTKCFTVALEIEHDVAEFNGGWEPETQEWWKQFPDKLAAITRAMVPSGQAMQMFATWLTQFEQPVLAGWPIVFDASFINYYWWNHIGTRPPFSHRGLDIRSLAMGVLNNTHTYSELTDKEVVKLRPQWINTNLPHTHRALDDAKQQAWLLQQILEERHTHRM